MKIKTFCRSVLANRVIICVCSRSFRMANLSAPVTLTTHTRRCLNRVRQIKCTDHRHAQRYSINIKSRAQKCPDFSVCLFFTYMFDAKAKARSDARIRPYVSLFDFTSFVYRLLLSIHPILFLCLTHNLLHYCLFAVV